MARKGFLYYLFSANKAPLYVDDNGNVQEGDPGSYTKPNGQPAHLEYSPDGWKDILVKYARNIKYWGLFRDMSVPMKFTGDGAKILRHLMWKDGVEAVCYLGVAKLNRTGLPYNYESWYLSEINFSKYVQTKDTVQVEALEGGLSKLLKANENTTYTIPIRENPKHINVKMDGMDFDITGNYIMIDQYIPYTDGLQFDMPITFINKEGFSAQDVAYFSQNLNSGPLFSTDNTNFFFYTKTARDVRVQGQIIVDILGGTNEFSFIFGDYANPATVYYQLPYINYTGRNVFTFDFTASLPAEGHMILYYFQNASGPKNILFSESNIKLSFVYHHRTTYIKGFYAKDLLQEILNKLTTNSTEYLLASSFLDSLTDVCITSGDALRKIFAASIKTSMSEFFKALNFFSIGLTISEKTLIIERLSYFFNSTTLVDLGNVDDIQITLAEDILFNTIKAGYAKQDYEDVSGKTEVNQGQIWSTPIKKVIKEQDLASPYRADPCGIEFTRINFDGKDSTDKSSDNDTFFLNIESDPSPVETTVDFFNSGIYMTNPDDIPFKAGDIVTITGSVSNNNTFLVAAVGVNIVQFDPSGPALVDESAATITVTFLSGGVYELKRPAYTAISGVPDTDNIFNVEFSPKRGLINNGSPIRSCLDLQDANLMKLESADKNIDLSTTLAGVTIDENEDIQIGGLGTKFFKPYYIQFKTKVPINLLALIKDNPFGKVKFTYNDNEFYGYLMDGGIAPATQDAQTWKLLSASENDMNKFKN